MDNTHSKSPRVAVLGGAFDPPHLGHFGLAKTALKTGLVDQVWLMPNFSHPWREAIAPAKDRLAMCKLLVNPPSPAPGGLRRARVSDLEIKRRGKSYTIDTVRELKRKFPDYVFFWLMGSDRLIDLKKWKVIERLLKEIKFIVLPKTTVSSTKIRERIKKGLSISGLVPKKVEEYIRKHNLYV